MNLVRFMLMDYSAHWSDMCLVLPVCYLLSVILFFCYLISVIFCLLSSVCYLIILLSFLCYLLSAVLWLLSSVCYPLSRIFFFVVVVDLPLLRVAVEGSDNPVSLEKPCQASLPPHQQRCHSLGRQPEVQYIA